LLLVAVGVNSRLVFTKGTSQAGGAFFISITHGFLFLCPQPLNFNEIYQQMKTLCKSIACSLTLFGLLHLTSSFAAAERFPDEDLIPFYVELVEDYESDIGRLHAGDRLVVVRPVDADHLRVNVSRKGTTTVPSWVTNVTAEISRVKQGVDVNLKIVPRMSFFLANRVMTGESEWKNPVPGEVINTSKRWLLLYGDAREPATREAVRAASDFYNRLTSSARSETVFVYMDIPGNKKAIGQLAASINPSIQCMPGYLSRGYSKSLDQISPDEALPQFVEVTSSGRMQHHIIGSAAVQTWLQHQAH
jgi:hypothetical protein